MSRAETQTLAFFHHQGIVERQLHHALARRWQVCHFGREEGQLVNGLHRWDLLRLVARERPPPSFLLYGTDELLASGVERLPIPSAIFYVDVFMGTARRIRLAMLFDVVFVCHPAFVSIFQRAGHPNVSLLPLAADPTPYGGHELERWYDVGWVGRLNGGVYRRRTRLVQKLAEIFRINEWWRWHRQEEMVEVYRRSKIMVNISRDDYPHGTNVRVFEAMAAGALLITGRPTELTELGFEEGTHFAAFGTEQELLEQIRYYLAHDEVRRRMAEAARELVLKAHTFDHRARTLVGIMSRHGDRRTAPARAWSQTQLRWVYAEERWHAIKTRWAAHLREATRLVR